MSGLAAAIDAQAQAQALELLQSQQEAAASLQTLERALASGSGSRENIDEVARALWHLVKHGQLLEA